MRKVWSLTIGLIMAGILAISACTPEQAEQFRKAYCQNHPERCQTASTTTTTIAPTTTTVAPTTTTVPSGNPNPVGVAGDWRLTFSDEFNDTTIDSSKWARSWFGTVNGYSRPINGSEDGCYHVDMATESGGVLNLRTASNTSSDCRKRDGSVAPIKGGIISSNDKFQQRYGYFEARIALDGAYNWPAWWTNGDHNSWPDRGELDVNELLSGRRQCAHVHFTNFNPSGACASSFLSGFHVYGMKWNETSVEFYYDGQKVGSTFNVSIPYEHYLILNHGVNSDYSNGMVSNVNMRVDYVRTWWPIQW